ncbi:hypothetical protein B8X02_00670 [Stenotrophomonas rhizophila]|uniref:hypothetical protein n=1 Tax=Stenotrophomonas TaxID=40323 RepID=UPI000BA5A9CE|nr:MULTISPECIES: hypothetical protein [Stenotrophomonas]MDQ1064428.1 hypothetical protein [Stenotrophomonas sp. SORGH_AS_0282]MDQ1190938.1 hypothetical protein [Stenotrophomonas sp. SORGH_AS_0282]PAK94396.1 hypothetical protein B8X02_00670 [Stenotrophomonas rhizophila]UQY87740.1 hypothetical protein LQE85_00435 [Stenotrophomonas rhizophila]
MSTMAAVAFDVLTNVLAAAVLGTAAMLRARVPDVSGVWTLTRYGQGPERHAEAVYLVMLSQNGVRVEGVAECVQCRVGNGPLRLLPGRERPRVEVSGGLYGSVFHRKRFRLLFRESARRQGSIATHGMDRRESDDHWHGSYILSAGGRSGDSEWRRGQGAHDFAVASDAYPLRDQGDARARSVAACAQRAATRGAVMHTA